MTLYVLTTDQRAADDATPADPRVLPICSLSETISGSRTKCASSRLSTIRNRLV